MGSVHQSIMVPEVLEHLKAEQGGIFLDCTLGGGGHSEAMLKAHPTTHVQAIDRDIRAVERSAERLHTFAERFNAQKAAFSELSQLFAGQRFSGIFADLGISSDQLAEQRGFSFNDTSPLDMRMDEDAEKSAYDIVNNSPDGELFKILKQGGVGKEARKILQQILRDRPIETTDALAASVHKVCGEYTQGQGRKNSATVVFQAIRMAVNQELEQIEALLNFASTAIVPSGRLVVLCFHSLEDKIVARKCRRWASGDEYSALWKGNRARVESRGVFLTRKAISPSVEEVRKNPRARSTRMRVFEFN